MDELDQQEVRRPRVMLAGDFRWGLVWGFVIVGVGVALLLDHLGVLPFGYLYRFWPLLLVLFGAMNILTQSGRAFGFLLIVAGALLVPRYAGLLLPVGLVAWAVLVVVLIRRYLGERRKDP